MKQVRVKTNKGTFTADVVKENTKTVWVLLPDGNLIKRHKDKHMDRGGRA